MQLISTEYPVNITGTVGTAKFIVYVGEEHTINDIRRADATNAKFMNHIQTSVVRTLQSFANRPYLSKGDFLADLYEEVHGNWPDSIKINGLMIEYNEPGLHILVSP
jgi:hypothetical protein